MDFTHPTLKLVSSITHMHWSSSSGYRTSNFPRLSDGIVALYGELQCNFIHDTCLSSKRYGLLLVYPSRDRSIDGHAILSVRVLIEQGWSASPRVQVKFKVTVSPASPQEATLGTRSLQTRLSAREGRVLFGSREVLSFSW